MHSLQHVQTASPLKNIHISSISLVLGKYKQSNIFNLCYSLSALSFLLIINFDMADKRKYFFRRYCYKYTGLAIVILLKVSQFQKTSVQ